MAKNINKSKIKLNYKKIVFISLIIIALHFLLIFFSPNYALLVSSVVAPFKGEYTTLSCSLVGGETINTLGDYRDCPEKDIMGAVTGLLCPCVCCKKNLNNLKSTSFINKIPTANPSLPISNLETRIEFSNYTPVNVYNLKLIQNNKYKYIFTQGQNNEKDVQNNYSLIFPKSWNLYTYTNESDSPMHGTNIVLTEGSDYIIIRQQLWESGSCVFDKKDARFCNLIDVLPTPHNDWKIYIDSYSNIKDNDGSQWTAYGVCDQDLYAQEITSYKTPDEHDKLTCLQLTQIGVIEYLTSSNNPENYNDFVEIIKSIKVL